MTRRAFAVVSLVLASAALCWAFASAGQAGKAQKGDDAPKDLDRETKTKVKAAVAWIARNQQKNGSWAEPNVISPAKDVVTASFCALALMADSDKHQAQVQRAALFVANNTLQDLSPIKLPPNLDQANWKFAIGGLFLAEYYASVRKRDGVPKGSPVHKALELVIKESLERMEESGGWGHTPRVKNGSSGKSVLSP
jgi:hypothetical protein